MKRFPLPALALFLAVGGFSVAAGETPSPVARMAIRKVARETTIRSCAAELTIVTQIDNAMLHAKYGSNYDAANLNNVRVTVFNSYVHENTVQCQYKSANGDIPNLVYRIPCPGAVPANNGYAHAYACGK